MSQGMLYRLLQRIDLEDEPIFTANELEHLGKDTLPILEKLGLIRRSEDLRSIECPECDEGTIEEVNFVDGLASSVVRAYITCSNREDVGPIPIPLEKLRRWKVYTPALIQHVSDAILPGFLVEELVDNRIWHVGKIIEGRSRVDVYLFRASHLPDLNQVIDSIAKKLGPTKPFFLFPFYEPAEFPLNIGNFKLRLTEIITLVDNALALDNSQIEGLIQGTFSRRTRRAQPIQPIEVPSGTPWEQIALTFINEETVRIEHGPKVLGHRSYIEMGFKDNRRSIDQPDQLWGHLRELARRNGVKGRRDPEDRPDSERVYSSEEELRDIDGVRLRQFAQWKDHIGNIRIRMRALFPIIQDNPIKYHRVAGEYQTKFTLIYPSE